MYFTKQFVTAFIASTLAQASRLNGDNQVSTYASAARGIAYEDRFSNSGMEYDDWADKMVEEGKLWRPDSHNETTTLQIRDGPTVSFNKVLCGYMYGESNEWQDAQTRFCDLVKQYSQITLAGIEYIVQDLACEGNQDCIFIAQLAFDQGIKYSMATVDGLCPQLFSGLQRQCSGYTGGQAQITITNGADKPTGTLNLQFYDKDTGATCPATTDSFVCRARSG
ncbi:hypothetical protein F4821DRAFT_274536 [Hypoxylon rubiginosum]|uniref:Uncharacterized protein n=1 Tax=Hypoxylon rubiginosum TaxID=110542 RepID=A0ACC0CNJ0_9PEZI|nr:hypothetical protein F4821DRAFT_274536 [Hypoxylon rubiginosum]